jgi:hypothetical protein
MSDLKLPELPDEPGLMCDVVPFFTEQQMLAIRDSGIRYGMERAAVIADEAEEYDRTLDNNPQAAQAAEFIAKAIRAALQE